MAIVGVKQLMAHQLGYILCHSTGRRCTLINGQHETCLCIVMPWVQRQSFHDTFSCLVIWHYMHLGLLQRIRPQLVMCKYSKFHTESSSQLLFDSIQNQSNYSKFWNTYHHQWSIFLNVIYNLQGRDCVSVRNKMWLSEKIFGNAKSGFFTGQKALESHTCKYDCKTTVTVSDATTRH